MIEEKMKQCGTINREAYLRKMAIDGWVIRLDVPELKEIISLLRYSGNNLNQIAKLAHTTGRIYENDIQEIQQQQEKLWVSLKEIISQFSMLP